MSTDPQDKLEALAKTKSAANKQREEPAIKVMLTSQKWRDEFAKALGQRMSVEAFVRVAQTAILAYSNVADCTPTSLIQGCLSAAQLGLSLDPLLGQAYLVPYRNHGIKEAQLQIGYKGMIVLAKRAGAASCAADVVYSNDHFDFMDGDSAFLRHRRALKDRGERVGVWALVTGRDGGKIWRVFGIDDINAIRARSKSGKGGKQTPWDTDYDEMARKTALRNVLKYAGLGEDDAGRSVAHALERDEAIDRSDDTTPQAALLVETSAESISDVMEAPREQEPVRREEGELTAEEEAEMAGGPR